MSGNGRFPFVWPLFALAILLLGCSGPNEGGTGAYVETADDAATRVKLLEALLRHFDAVRRHDVKGSASLFTDDAVHVIARSSSLLTPHRVEGRAAIDEMEADIVNIEAIDAPHTLHSVCRVGDMAFVIATQAGTIKMKGKAAETFSLSLAWGVALAAGSDMGNPLHGRVLRMSGWPPPNELNELRKRDGAGGGT